MSRLGVYLAPGHYRPTDLEYIRRLQPAAVRILDPSPTVMRQVHDAAPDALLLPRDWALSEQKDDVRANPEETGYRHAREWREKLNSYMLPTGTRVAVVGINEPPVWEDVEPWVRYTVAFLDECTRLGMKGCALNLSVGWPNNTGPGTPPDWTPFEPVHQAIKRGGHFLCVHEYWYHVGPDAGWGWYAGRILSCPWDVPIIIGECGVDNYVDAARWKQDGGARGWQGHMMPDAYADQLVAYVNKLDSRIVAVTPFLTDYRSREWSSFDTEPAHSAILDRLHQVKDFPPAPEPAKPDDNWERSIAFVLRWEGGWSDNPADPGGATMRGITLNTYTNWRRAHGQPAPMKDDLRALTVDEAKRIYRAWYWEESGADSLPWPLCLVHFDAAVNSGPWRAGQLLRGSGGDFDQYLANRIDWYASLIKLWPDFGRAWTRRCADVLRVGRKA